MENLRNQKCSSQENATGEDRKGEKNKLCRIRKSNKIEVYTQYSVHIKYNSSVHKEKVEVVQNGCVECTERKPLSVRVSRPCPSSSAALQRTRLMPRTRRWPEITIFRWIH